MGLVCSLPIFLYFRLLYMMQCKCGRAHWKSDIRPTCSLQEIHLFISIHGSEAFVFGVSQVIILNPLCTMYMLSCIHTILLAYFWQWHGITVSLNFFSIQRFQFYKFSKAFSAAFYLLILEVSCTLIIYFILYFLCLCFYLFILGGRGVIGGGRV